MFAAVLMAIVSIGCTSQQEKAYLLSYFADEGAGLLMAYSYDGLSWTDLSGGKPMMKPVLGPDQLLRDPSICKGPEVARKFVFDRQEEGQCDWSK